MMLSKLPKQAVAIFDGCVLKNCVVWHCHAGRQHFFHYSIQDIFWQPGVVYLLVDLRIITFGYMSKIGNDQMESRITINYTKYRPPLATFLSY